MKNIFKKAVALAMLTLLIGLNSVNVFAGVKTTIEKGKEKLPEKVLVWIESYGTLWYVLIGMVGIVKGAPFLANKFAGINLGTPNSIFSGGLISLLGLGVGIRVASTMVTLFFAMKGEES